MTGAAAASPVLLAPNTVPSFYPGTGRIGALRRDPTLPADDPEDWIASTARRTGMGDRGLSTLPDGTRLVDALADDPHPWLGPGRDRNGLLVKLLDAGRRLPLHVHPDRSFAGAHLGSPAGKTEAWIVLDADPGAYVHLGFSRDVTADELESWVRTQSVDELLDATRRVPVSRGDVLLCPAGVPHAIGAGVFVVELQEATDLSIMLEWAGYPIETDDVFLGLDQDEALAAADRGACDDARLQTLRGRALQGVEDAERGVVALLPPAADPFFCAEQVRPGPDGALLDQRFAVLVVLAGSGRLTGRWSGPQDVHAGQTWLVPHAAGPTTLTGDVLVVRCAPA
ncbi:class I mannose-6-phosphate isomerase [Cellulomonas sp. HZM]|uniref:class I mannose-6-phosphate isomerase n=1 Tax=Cellulomonas sp. HZM TaxID=1454010 RepID=UPI00049324CD|nr:class I mannose-6-phosphate isomerase [Cellulomonas sp. HZM]